MVQAERPCSILPKPPPSHLLTRLTRRCPQPPKGPGAPVRKARHHAPPVGEGPWAAKTAAAAPILTVAVSSRTLQPTCSRIKRRGRRSVQLSRASTTQRASRGSTTRTDTPSPTTRVPWPAHSARVRALPMRRRSTEPMSSNAISRRSTTWSRLLPIVASCLWATPLGYVDPAAVAMSRLARSARSATPDSAPPRSFMSIWMIVFSAL